jgi:protein-tyrosine-phosphatase
MSRMTAEDKRKFKILFVCTGNTCRSPMAEGLLKHILDKKGVDNVEVKSAGIFGLHFYPASTFAVEAVKSRGGDLSQHRSRALNRDMIEKSDLILVMSPEHREHISRQYPHALNKTYLLKSFPAGRSASNGDEKQGVLSIEDPIGGSPEDYQRSCLEIEEQINRILPEILRRAGKS